MTLAVPLQQLRGFRHVFSHAYDLAIDAERLGLVLRDAETTVRALSPACESFLAHVAKQEGWSD